MQADLERSKEDLETAYEELQSTNEELETMNEEITVEASNRKGRTIQCRVGCSPVTIQDRAGVMLVMADGED